MEGDFCTYIHETCEFKGTLTFEGTTRVDGKVSGDIFSHHMLIIGPTGVVDGEIHVGTLIIYGCVKGRVMASERVEAKGEAKVHADVMAPVVQFAEGVLFDGKVQMSLLES